MAKFYLTVNKQRKDKLDWFGEREGTFKVAIGGDGAPFGKDDQALAWLVSFLNCGKCVCSSGENFLLFGANCSEDCEPVFQICNNAERADDSNREENISYTS